MAAKKTKLTQIERAKRFKRALVRAVNKHIAKGGKVAVGSFQIGAWADKKFCPITCYVDGFKSDLPAQTYQDRISQKIRFRVSKNEMRSFIAGFDGYEDGSGTFYNVGKQLRDKYAAHIVINTVY